MKTLPIVAGITAFMVATALAAPGDPIEVKDLKSKVSLTLGTKGTIQFKQQGDALAEPTLANDPEGKQPGVSIEVKREPEFFALLLQNRLPKALRYRAAIRLKGRQNYVETSLALPVMAGLVSFETWQDPVEELVLFDFKLTHEKQQ